MARIILFYIILLVFNSTHTLLLRILVFINKREKKERIVMSSNRKSKSGDVVVWFLSVVPSLPDVPFLLTWQIISFIGSSSMKSMVQQSLIQLLLLQHKTIILQDIKICLLNQSITFVTSTWVSFQSHVLRETYLPL